MMIRVLRTSWYRKEKEERNILDATKERASEEGHKEVIIIMVR
jgi:hypothetical protein